MSSRWFWSLLVLFLVGGIGAGLLYRRYRTLNQKQIGIQVQAPNAQTFGSAVITYSGTDQYQKEYLRTAVLNKLTVEDFSLDVVEIKGEKKPRLNLIVSFDYQGEGRRLIIPIVGEILFRKRGPEEFEEGEDVSVTSLNLEKGRLINVALSYIPNGAAVNKEELSEFCGRTNYEMCLMYMELGFGDRPVDFDVYLQNIVGDQETALLDYQVVFPNTLFLLRN